MIGIIFLITLACMFLIYMVSNYLSEFFAQKVHLLLSTMQQVEKGNLSTQLRDDCPDEMGQLTNSFQHMIRELDRLVVEDYKNKIILKETQLMALQAQINPHFLYNSLDLINCTAISRNVPEISRMVNALGQFYRLSLSSGREVITLAEELRHAKLYVEIQNLRFENRVSAEWDMDPSADCCQIIKIVLQPIIENAIIHGIFEKPSKTGHLKVSIRRLDGDIRITVEDDGMGMDEETVLANFSVHETPERRIISSGYGIRRSGCSWPMAPPMVYPAGAVPEKAPWSQS